MLSQTESSDWRLDEISGYNRYRKSLIHDGYHFVEAGLGYYNAEPGNFCLAGPMTIDDARLIASAAKLRDILARIVDDASLCTSACSRMVDAELIEEAERLLGKVRRG